jgi:hypothetical protein
MISLLMTCIVVDSWRLPTDPPLTPAQTEPPADEQPAESLAPATPEPATARGAEMAQPAQAPARCPIFELSTGQPATGNADPLALLLASSSVCPTDVFELRDLLKDEGAQLTTAMVANRGFHNPEFGSFSLFEMVDGPLASIDTAVEKGEFFFGHFTAPEGSELIADQDPRRGSLMVELIAWDPDKGAFNFYELRGTGTQGVWVYNGDSFDILETSTLHRQPDQGASVWGEPALPGCHGRWADHEGAGRALQRLVHGEGSSTSGQDGGCYPCHRETISQRG